jgi:hypothetical protein
MKAGWTKNEQGETKDTTRCLYFYGSSHFYFDSDVIPFILAGPQLLYDSAGINDGTHQMDTRPFQFY